jgi:hypothetical protein
MANKKYGSIKTEGSVAKLASTTIYSVTLVNKLCNMLWLKSTCDKTKDIANENYRPLQESRSFKGRKLSGKIEHTTNSQLSP